MYLSFEQIKSITVGSANIYCENGLIKFAKATKEQIDAWVATGYGKSVPATTGIRLDFHSNTKSFSFRALSENYRYEILVDGTSILFTKPTCEVDGASIFLDGNEHRITLLLPFHSEGILKSVEIDDGATLIPRKYDCKIMFWGDSLTQGWHSTQDSLGYAFRVSEHFNAESIILGNGGSIFTPDAVVSDYPFSPDLIVVAYGTNDWGRTPSFEQLKDNCKRFLDNINKYFKGVPVIGITPTWRKDLDKPRPNGTFEELVKILNDEYTAHGVYVVDGLTLFPHEPALLTDPVHPNDKCFGIYAENLIPHIEKFIKK